MFIIFLIILILLFLIIINISIPWTGDIDYKLIDLFKNGYIKYKHKKLNVPLNKKVCKENLEIIRGVLNNLNIKFWLSEGTALGARREGNFISHDDDVDIGMWYADYNKFKKNAIHILRNNDFTIDCQLLDNTFICLSRKGEKIDIDFTDKNIKCMACRTKNANCTYCNPMLPYLKNMSHINFLGKQYLCPDIDYLEYLYGKDWNISKKEKFINV